MTNHFITVIGMGSYNPVIYYDPKAEQDGESLSTRFVQEAIIRQIIGIDDDLKISIFATSESIEKNYKNSDANEGCGLHDVLVKDCKIDEDRIHLVTIPAGNDERELMELFHKVVDEINDDECVYFDITHSFRSLPMQIMAAICFCNVVKNIEVGGIYYGAFQNDCDKVPIINLSPFLDIIQLSHAAHSFSKYGNSGELHDFSKSYSDKFRGVKNDEAKEAEDMARLAVSLKYLTESISTSRGAYVDGNKRFKKGQMSISRAFSIFKERVVDYRSKPYSMHSPISRLTDLLEKKTGVFDKDFGFDLPDVNGNLRTGLATVEWAISNGLTQQGYTALDETIKTYLCLKYGLDETNKDYRECVCKQVCVHVYQEGIKNGNESYKEIVRQEMLERIKEDDSLLSIDIDRIIDDLPLEIARVSCEIGDLRNTMNHFGYSMLAQIPSDKLISELKGRYETFLSIISNQGA